MGKDWLKWFGIAGALVGIALIGFLLVGNGGDISSGEIPETSAAFSEASERFTGSSDADGMTRTHSFEVEPGHASMTVYAALDFPDEGSWELRNPDGQTLGQSSQRAQEIPVLSLIVHRPEPGSWDMVVRCEGVCEYSLGASMGDRLSRPSVDLSQDVSTHDEVIHVTHDADAAGQETFEVPRGAQSLHWSSSFYMADGGGVTVSDPSGEEVRSMGWGAEWLIRGMSSQLAEQPAAGTWTIEYSCTMACEATWGITAVMPPEDS